MFSTASTVLSLNDLIHVFSVGNFTQRFQLFCLQVILLCTHTGFSLNVLYSFAPLWHSNARRVSQNSIFSWFMLVNTSTLSHRISENNVSLFGPRWLHSSSTVLDPSDFSVYLMFWPQWLLGTFGVFPTALVSTFYVPHGSCVFYPLLPG